jgi:hypothetical protein
MIRVHTTGLEGERFLELDEVNIVSHKIDYNGRPYILFEHKDYPGGALRAEFDGGYWDCDLD